LNLIAPRTGSSFDARTQSVNALTEELGYIRFPVQLRADFRKLSGRI
jgi:hypothetical protein